MSNENFPVLARDRLDYSGGAYEVIVNRAASRDGMAVTHAVTGQNLVTTLLKQSKAVFAVEVSSPYATYRRTHAAEANGKAEFIQQVSWSLREVVPPVYVRPLVLAVHPKSAKIQLNGQHGVHKVWQGQEVEIRAGTILATDQFWRAASTWQSLIRLVSDDTLVRGSYRVEAITGEGYHFEVHMHSSLFEKMVSPGEGFSQRDSILTACLSRGLELVREEFGSNDNQQWRQHPVLRALYDKLLQSGIETWDDQNFRADEVATRLKPIEFGINVDA